MRSSEIANLPAWRGQPGYYEIWFLVVFDPEPGRATWLRYTTFAPASGGEPRATLWAAAFDDRAAEPKVAAKAVFPISSYDGGDRFHVRIGGAEIGHGFCRGEVRAEHAIAWDLHFTPAASEASRTPRLLHRLPLPTRGAHANVGVPFEGWVEVDGVRRALSGAHGTQSHIHGTRRVEELFWLYGSRFEEDPGGGVEVVSVRPIRHLAGASLPAMTSLWLRGGGEEIDLTDLPLALTGAMWAPGPGLLRARAASPTRVVTVTASCDPRTLVGYVYRDPGGADLHVAQSDVASCVVEVHRRAHPLAPLRPERRLTSTRAAAIEFHGPEPLEGVRYIAWDAADPPSNAAVTPRAQRPLDTAPRDGRFEPLPPPTAIHALGLTYREHVRETASRADPAVFVKSNEAWLPEGHEVVTPSSDALIAALDRVEPGLGAELRARLGFLPAILDYEVELGMMLLADAPRRALADPRFEPEVGFFVANDLTARSCQILGEGRPDPMPYWGLAKSFPGFLPVTHRMWIPARPGAVPDVTLTTRVNGEARQRAPARDLLFSPRQMVALASRAAGRDLARGEVVLTGTPSGVAFQVPALKRWIADRVLDRFGKLRASITAYAASRAFLSPGDRVEVEAGFLGRRAVVVAGARA